MLFRQTTEYKLYLRKLKSKTVKCIKIPLITVLCVFAAENAESQELSPLALSFNRFSNEHSDKPLLSNANLSVNFPYYHDSTFVALVGLNIRYYNYQLPEDSLMNSHSFYAFSIPFKSILKLSENKILTVLFEPCLSSDMKGISNDDFRFNSAIIYGNPLTQNGALQVGLGISKLFNNNYFIIPLFFFNLPINNSLRFSGSFPLKQKLTYTLNDKHLLGLSTGFTNASFRMSEASNNRSVNMQQLGVELFYQRKIQKHLKIELSCGYKSLRTSVYNKQDHTSYTFFPFNWDKMGNTLETIKSTGTTLQISFYYSLF